MAHDEEHTGPVDQMLDLFVYAPIGFMLEARTLIPRLVNRGRGQVVLARTLGEMAVKRGNSKAETALSDLVGRFSSGSHEGEESDSGSGAPPGTPAGGNSDQVTPDVDLLDPDPAELSGAEPADAMEEIQGHDEREPMVDIDPDDLAIPDYDSLSASQVVPRLASLSVDELTLVGDYERGHRGRKTILNRVAQIRAG